MSEIEQQYMETSENGHEVEDDFNGAGHTEEEGIEESAVNECGEGEEADLNENSQNGGTEGGQIDASKGEEDAGWVKCKEMWKLRETASWDALPCFFVQPAFVGAICRAEGGWALQRGSNLACISN